MTAPGGFRFAVSGAGQERLSPVFFLLASDMDDTISNQTLARLAQPWREAGGMVVALDSPSHGAEQPPDEKNSLREWRDRLLKGDNFVPASTARLSALLDHLARGRLADEARVAVAGISRGGFLAVHLAAVEPRTRWPPSGTTCSISTWRWGSGKRAGSVSSRGGRKWFTMRSSGSC
jgi:pimeloyl-ACP methyl ester carboxylesterase